MFWGTNIFITNHFSALITFGAYHPFLLRPLGARDNTKSKLNFNKVVKINALI